MVEGQPINTLFGNSPRRMSLRLGASSNLEPRRSVSNIPFQRQPIRFKTPSISNLMSPRSIRENTLTDMTSKVRPSLPMSSHQSQLQWPMWGKVTTVNIYLIWAWWWRDHTNPDMPTLCPPLERPHLKRFNPTSSIPTTRLRTMFQLPEGRGSSKWYSDTSGGLPYETRKQRVLYKDEATNESYTLDSLRSQRPKKTVEQKQHIIAWRSL